MLTIVTKKRKKIHIILASIFATLIVLLIIIRVTGILQYYVVATISNEPTLHTGDKLFFTNCKTPNRGDFVNYTCSTIDSFVTSKGWPSKPGTHWLHRLCAIEGDVIEMKDGVFYVNGNNFDSAYNLDLSHLYIVANKYTESLPDSVTSSLSTIHLNDSVDLINLTTVTYNDYSKGIALIKCVHIPRDTSSPIPFLWCNQSSQWSIDNFGPLTIPKGYTFLLGDNRNNSLDSRYTGFINLKNIKGVQL